MSSLNNSGPTNVLWPMKVAQTTFTFSYTTARYTRKIKQLSRLLLTPGRARIKDRDLWLLGCASKSNFWKTKICRIVRLKILELRSTDRKLSCNYNTKFDSSRSHLDSSANLQLSIQNFLYEYSVNVRLLTAISQICHRAVTECTD